MARPIRKPAKPETQRLRGRRHRSCQPPRFLGCPLPKRQGRRVCRKSSCVRVLSTAKKATVMPLFLAAETASVDPLQEFFAGNSISFQLDVAGGRFDHRGAQSQPHQLVHIGFHGARESPEFGFQPRLLHQLNGFRIFGRDPRKTGFDAADAQFVELAGDLQLLLRREHHPDRLLAVAQRRVIEAHGVSRERRANLRTRIQFADPDLGIGCHRENVRTHQRHDRIQGLSFSVVKSLLFQYFLRCHRGWLMSVGFFPRDHAIPQHTDLFDLALHHVARLQIPRLGIAAERRHA